MNVELAENILEYIQAHPDEWNQKWWHCGATYCFAGLIAKGDDEIMQYNSYGSFDVIDRSTGENLGVIHKYAAERLGLTIWQADILFNEDNSLDDLKRLIEVLSDNPGISGENLAYMINNDAIDRDGR